MVRISDACMSGTAYGTVVRHTSPEAAGGGPLAVVRNGDMISLGVPNRNLTLEIFDEELAARLAAWVPPADAPASGYGLAAPQPCRGRAYRHRSGLSARLPGP